MLDPPSSHAEFTAMMVRLSALNASLLNYAYSDTPSSDLRANWNPFTDGCQIKYDCYCHHVKGDMSRSVNPSGWRSCYDDNSGRLKTKVGEFPHYRAECDSNRTAWDRFTNAILGPSFGRPPKLCGCLSGSPCLFSDMRPAKLLAAITAARAAGVTHIIEEGRFGGLSSYIYSIHGFDVTSVEFLPLDGPSAALHQLAPAVRQLNGNGLTLLPKLVSKLTDREAARTMVIFDGEKRFMAWDTFQKFRERVALAIFDDTNLDGRRFPDMLDRTGQVFFNTEDPAYKGFVDKEQPGLDSKLAPLRRRKGVNWFGGVNQLQDYHFAVVRGGGWRKATARAAAGATRARLIGRG